LQVVHTFMVYALRNSLFPPQQTVESEGGAACFFAVDPVWGRSKASAVRIRLRTFLSKFIGLLLHIHTREAFHPT